MHAKDYKSRAVKQLREDLALALRAAAHHGLGEQRAAVQLLCLLIVPWWIKLRYSLRESACSPAYFLKLCAGRSDSHFKIL
jgi:hypothetical protein